MSLNLLLLRESEKKDYANKYKEQKIYENETAYVTKYKRQNAMMHILHWV